MAGTTFFNTPWSDRGPIERGLILGGTIGGSILLAIKMKSIIENIKARKKENTLFKDQQSLNKGGQVPSYQDTQYNVFADTLYQSMKGVGTYEEEVAGVMYKMKNDIDILKLIQAFGTRGGFSLSEWIADDFDQEDKAFYINDILQRKGIKYRF
jgi:hypothetical protein